MVLTIDIIFVLTSVKSRENFYKYSKKSTLLLSVQKRVDVCVFQV